MNILKDDIKKLYSKYLVASMGGALAMSIYSFVDTIAVGQSAGPNGAAAIAVINPLYGILLFLAILCGIGGSVLMSKAKGEGDEVKGNAYFTASVIVMAFFNVLFWLLFALFADDIYALFGANSDIMPYVKKYARWIVYFSPVFFFSYFLACFVRNDGAPVLAMRAVIVGGSLNIFGDWFLVFPMGMGMAGAAIATVLGTTLQLLILCSHFLSKKCTLRLVKPGRPFRAFGEVLATGFGSSLIESANIVLFCIFNNQIMRYGGSDALAVFGVVATVSFLFQALFSGVGQAVQPLVSTNFGAGEHVRIRQVLHMSMKTGVIMGVFFTSMGLFFPREIIRLFMDATPEVLALAPVIVRTYFLTFLFMGVSVISTYYLQSIMKARMSALIALLRGAVLSGLLLIVLPLFIGIQGVWWAMPAAECLVALMAACYLRRIQHEDMF